MVRELLQYIKSKEDFEKFCNLFLKKEVSRQVKVYGAPGRDMGIDADYKGTYNGQTGYWVFQYKFFDPTMDKQRARSNFISVIKGSKKKKGELEKAHDIRCNHYVLMTNIELTPGNIKEIEEIKLDKGYTFSLNCWHKTELETRLADLPYIMTSFLPPNLQVFFSWQEMFKFAIEGQHRLLRYDYETFGREKEIELFQSFIQNPNQKLLLLYGAGGIGKTKLAIEFAQTIEKEELSFEPLFIRADIESLENFLQDIPPNRKYVFFIDNAHDFYSFYGSFRAILNSDDYKESKAVLITRKPFKDFVKGNFLFNFPPEEIEELELMSLSREKTKEFIQTYAKVTNDTLLNHLATIVHDTPLIAVMAIYLYKNGVDLSQLTKDELVELAFESYLKDIFSQHLPESSQKHRELLDWFSGIEPIQAEDNRTHQELADALNVEPYQEAKLCDDLLTYGLLIQRGQKQRIFPDQLSDYVLRKACFLNNNRLSSFHDVLLVKFLQIAPTNVIKNLAKVEYIIGQKILLDELVAYLKDDVREGNNLIRHNILNSIEGLCYFRPLDATEIFNIILDNPKEDYQIKDRLWGSINLTHLSLAQKILKESRKTIYSLSGFIATLELLKKLLMVGDLQVPRSDSPTQLLKDMVSFKTNKAFIFQEKALEAFEEWRKEDKPELSLSLLEALSSLFEMEFTEATSQGGAIVITWHYLTYTPELVQLREQGMDLLKGILQTSQHIEVRKKAIECINNALHPRRMRGDATPQLNQDILKKEQDKLFEMLENLMAQENNFIILNSLDLCLNNCIKFSKGLLKQKALELVEKSKAMSNYDKYLFYRQFVGQFKDWDADVEQFVSKYIQRYSPKELSQLMLECVKAAEKGWDYGSARATLFTVGKKNPQYGVELLDYIVAWQIDESHYASGLLNSIRLADKMEGKKATIHLLEQNSIFAKRIIARSYRQSDGQEYDKDDLEILDKLSQVEDERLRGYITESLPHFYAVDTNGVLNIFERLATDKSQWVLSEVASVLTDKQSQFSPQEHLGKYKKIMNNYVNLEKLDFDTMAAYYIENALSTIFKHDALWVIEFFEKRITKKEQEPKSDYEPLPYEFFHLFKDIDWNDENTLSALRRVMEWAIESPPGYKSWEAPGLLKSIIRGKAPAGGPVNINQTLKKLLEEWIESGDLDRIRKAAYLMREFVEDCAFYALVEEILVHSKGDKKVQSELDAAISTGVYSRGFGAPSLHHLQRIKYLEAMRDKSKSSTVRDFAQRLIQSTEQMIQRELQEDEELLDE